MSRLMELDKDRRNKMVVHLNRSADLVVDTDETGSLDIHRALNHDIIVTLHTSCCTCNRPVVVEFNLGVQISAEPDWQVQPANCEHCEKRQLKKIRFYIQARKDGMGG